MTSSRSPRVTVGLPFFNERRWLAEAVRSILRQTFDDFELLLVDDGSTDGSLDIARSFQDPRVVVLADGRRRHLPARLNEIVLRARGELVARMDADDVVHPTRLEREVALLDADPVCDVVGTWAGIVDDSEEVLGVVESAEFPATPRVALERGLLVHASIVGRRKWFAAHPYDESLTRAEDRDLWCRTVSTSTFGVVREPLYVVRLSAADSSFLPGYLEGQAQNRKLVLRHGPGAVGLVRSFRLLLATHAKGGVMRAAARTGQVGRVLRRRGRPPSVDELVTIRETLAPNDTRGV